MNTEQTGQGESDEQKSASETPEEPPSFQPDQIKTHKMEVHHHPDLHDKKKHWQGYFLEFLMIFLAVTMGFPGRKPAGTYFGK